MRDIHLEELISAYVDGELTFDERTLVERELSQSQASQQLYQQLLRQRQLLSMLPRIAAPSDLASRVLGNIERSEAVAPGKDVREHRDVPELHPIESARRKRLRWNVLLGVASAVAAGLLIAVVMRDQRVDHPLKPPVEELAVKQIDPSLRLVAFQERFRFLFIYDISITPKGRESKILDQWLKAADIRIERSVAIEDKLEAGVLESRFVGDEKIVAGDRGLAAKDDVEMILVRAKGSQIDAFLREWYEIRGRDQDQANLRLDMAMAPKELEIFLRLNDAIDGKAALNQVSSDSWSTPGAFRFTSRQRLQTATEFGSLPSPPQLSPTVPVNRSEPLDISLTANQNDAAQEVGLSSDDKNVRLDQLPGIAPTSVIGADDPSQVLIIVRNLKKDVVFPGVRGGAQ